MALHQVTSLTAGPVATILIMGPKAQYAILSNVGTNQINLALDGGAYNAGGVNWGNTDPASGTTGLCTPLPGGQTLTLSGDTFVGIPIRATMASGTTTLNIQTGAYDTSATVFPTN